MPNGNNSAKEALWAEAEEHAKHLTNGSAADPARHGHALAFLIRSLKPMFLASFVTEEGLETRLGAYREDCPVHKIHAETTNRKPSFFHVPNLPTALTLLGSLYGVMRLIIYFSDKT